MYCANCGKEKGKKACTSCGQKKVKEIKFCKWCGSELEPGQVICINCKEDVKPKTVPVLLGNLLLVVLFVVLLFISFDAVGLMSLFSLIGIVLSLPAVRNIVMKKTHDKIEKRKISHILRYALIFITFIACVATINLTDYNAAINNFEEDPLVSLETMESFGDYKDAPEKVKEFKTKILEDAKILITNGDFKTAEEYLKAVGEFEGAEKVGKELNYQKAIDFDKKHKYGDAKKLFESVGDYKDAKKFLSEIEYGLIGNEYSYSAMQHIFGKKRAVSHKRIFSDATSTVHVIQSFYPEVYYGDGDSLNVSETYQFKFEGKKEYLYNSKLEAPEKTEDWIESDLYTDIVWEGNTIKSFKAGGVTYKIEAE